MKNRVLVFLMVCALLLVSVGTAAAQGGTELQALADGAVTLYAEPNADAEVVAELGAYSTMTLLATDETGTWLEVEAAEGTGFVMLEDAIVMNLPLLAPKVYVSTAQAGATGLYAEPAFSADFVTSLPDGTVGTVLATEGEWAYVTTDAGLGWSVTTAWVALPAGAYPAMVTLGSAPEMGVFVEPNISSDVVGTVPNGEVIWVLGEATAALSEIMLPDGSTGYAVQANLGPLPNTRVDAAAGANANPALFAEADFAADVVAQLEPGTPLTYVGAVDDFWLELYHPAYGFVYGLADSFGPVYMTVEVPQADSLVRAGPNDNLYGVVAQLPAGQTVIAKGINETGAWIEVAIPFEEVDFGYNGVDGWMRDFLFADAMGETVVDVSILEVTE